ISGQSAIIPRRGNNRAAFGDDDSDSDSDSDVGRRVRDWLSFKFHGYLGRSDGAVEDENEDSARWLYMAVRAAGDEGSTSRDLRGFLFVPPALNSTYTLKDHLADPTLKTQFLSASSDLLVAMYDACCKWMLGGDSEVYQIAAFDIGEETETQVVIDHDAYDREGEYDDDDGVIFMMERVIFRGSFIAKRVLIVDASEYLQTVMSRYDGDIAYSTMDDEWEDACHCPDKVESFFNGHLGSLKLDEYKKATLPAFASDLDSEGGEDASEGEDVSEGEDEKDAGSEGEDEEDAKWREVVDEWAAILEYDAEGKWREIEMEWAAIQQSG
ncbi:hypothetical protein HK405_009214, partial [Cladochytrium tenue]